VFPLANLLDMASFSQVTQADQDTPRRIGAPVLLHRLGPRIHAFAGALKGVNGRAKPGQSEFSRLTSVGCPEAVVKHALGHWLPPSQQR
jgi:hypothetical protein